MEPDSYYTTDGDIAYIGIRSPSRLSPDPPIGIA